MVQSYIARHKNFASCGAPKNLASARSISLEILRKNMLVIDRHWGRLVAPSYQVKQPGHKLAQAGHFFRVQLKSSETTTRRIWVILIEKSMSLQFWYSQDISCFIPFKKKQQCSQQVSFFVSVFHNFWIVLDSTIMLEI